MNWIPFERYDGNVPSPFAVYRPAGVGLGAFNAADLGIAHFANTIDVTQAQYFVPEIWAQAAIPFLRANIVATPRIMRDSEIATFNVGDTLHVPYPGTFSVNDKGANTEYTIQQPNGETEVQLTLNKHREVSFTIEDIVRAEANQDTLARFGEAAAIALAEDVETNVLAELVTGAGSNTVGTYGTDATLKGLTGAWKQLTDQKAPPGDRYAAISTKDVVSMLDDSKVAALLAYSRGNQLASDPNNFGPMAGFTEVLASQLITQTAGTPLQTKNVAWRRDAALIAFRGMPEPPPGLGATRTNILDPVSGIVISVLMGYDIRLGGVQVTYELLYGVKTLQAAKITLFRT